MASAEGGASNLPRAVPCPAASPLPPLPPRSEYARGGTPAFLADHAGPTPLSNWVIRGRLLASAYPSPFPPGPLAALSSCRLSAVVCLMEPAELRALPPYSAPLAELAREAGRRPPRPMGLAVADGGVGPDEAVVALVADIARTVLRTGTGGGEEEAVLLHCLGGHGRTGTVAALVLAALYGISSVEAMDRVQAAHDARGESRGAASPETGPQREQVCSLGALTACFHGGRQDEASTSSSLLFPARIAGTSARASSSKVGRGGPAGALIKGHLDDAYACAAYCIRNMCIRNAIYIKRALLHHHHHDRRSFKLP